VARFDRDPVREDRIDDEIVVDCYDEYGVALGWFRYLEEHLPLPFQATYHPDGEHPRQVWSWRSSTTKMTLNLQRWRLMSKLMMARCGVARC
jgi:Calcium binding